MFPQDEVTWGEENLSKDGVRLTQHGIETASSFVETICLESAAVIFHPNPPQKNGSAEERHQDLVIEDPPQRRLLLNQQGILGPV